MISNSTNLSKKFTRITLAFFITGFFVSFSLWNSNRTFPTFPVFDILHEFQIVDICLQYLILISALFVSIFPNTKRVFAVAILIVISILFDQTRIQPWVYFYLLCFLGLTFSNNWNEQKKFLQIVFIGLYIWSGFHKINPLFRDVIFESILVDGFKVRSIETVHFAKQFYLLVPFLEILSGIFLLFPKTRQKGITIGLAGHLFILYYLFFGLKGNWVVIPWNFFLMIGLVLLFYRNKDTFQLPKKTIARAMLAISFIVLPIGYISGYADHSLSFGLYDGKLKSAYVLNEENSNFKVHENLLEKGSIIDLNKWCFEELEVPFYPEERFLKKLMAEKKQITILVTDIPQWKRHLLATYKTEKEKLDLLKRKQIERLIFKDSIYIGNYTLLHK